MTEAPSTPESRTRDRVLRAISEDGPVTAAALARGLGLTAAAVRRHLEALDDDGLIARRVDRAGQGGPGAHRGRGRPARAWVVSERGHAALTSDYDHLATEALRFLERTAGPEAVRAFAEQRVGELERRYAVEVEAAGPDPAARADRLVDALTRDGFAASARPVEGAPAPLAGVQLCQGHCPVQHAAREFPQFCDAETDAFSRLLGVHVQRLATLAHGEHVCTTFIPTAPTAPAAASPPHGQDGSTPDDPPGAAPAARTEPDAHAPKERSTR